MTINQNEIIGILNRVQESIQTGAVPVSEVPMDDLLKLLEATLGGTFWKGIGATAQNCFDNMPQRCENLLRHCQMQNDAQGFVLALELLKTQYQCIYAVLSKEELDKRIKPHKALAVRIGSAYAAVQYWLHQDRRAANASVSDNAVEGKKGVVYTCIRGKNRKPSQPEYINVHWDYICFTDEQDKWNTRDGVWEFRKLDATEEAYYYYKLMPHKVLGEYDYSIWINPQIQIIGELERFYKIYGQGSTFLGIPAYVQDNLYEALRTNLRADDENIELRRILYQFREEGFPEHFGMINTNLIYRSHRDEVLKNVMDTWWRQAQRCSQLREFGFAYAAWKNRFDFALCDLFAEWNPYIKNVDMDLEIGE